MKGITMKSSHRGLRMAVSAAILTTASLVMAACGGSEGGNEPPGEEVEVLGMDAVDAALEEGGTITFWSWATTEDVVKEFEKKYPNVDVKLVNVGTGDEHYTKLQNTIKAGSGAPDVAQVEFHILPQFALPGHLLDLRTYGFDEFEDDYIAADWETAHVGDGLYGLPQGGGPMALFYNKAVFDKYGISVPTTWDEYLEAARKLHEADPKKFITGDTGDPGFAAGMIWQAGGHPFQVDGSEITINLQDEGTKLWTSYWNQLIQEDLLAPYPHWTEEWFRALGDGTIATLPFGGWQAGVLAGLENGSGDWRVAPMPTYDGTPASAQHGGTHYSVIEQSENPALAAGFVRWINHEEGVDLYVEAGGIPSTLSHVQDPEFLNKEWEFFGGQKVMQVIIEASETIVPGWEFLPYQAYANSVFGDTAGKSYLKKSDINDGLASWQESLVEYGNQQGFHVNGG